MQTQVQALPSATAEQAKQLRHHAESDVGAAVSTHQFADNRPEAATQLRLQSLMANSAGVAQLKNMQSMMAASAQARHGSVVGDVAPVQRKQTETPVVQRMVLVGLGGENDDVVIAKGDGRRPGRTSLPGNEQGDHTTAYTVLEAQVCNAIGGASLEDAWDNLSATFALYQALPGWVTSKKFVTKDTADYVADLLAKKGDIEALGAAANELLVMRNQIDLTSLKSGHGGNGEGGWGGGLQYQEEHIDEEGWPVEKKAEYLLNMVHLIDARRFDNMGASKIKKIALQHAMTVVDAYPRVCATVDISQDDVFDGLVNTYKLDLEEDGSDMDI